MLIDKLIHIFAEFMNSIAYLLPDWHFAVPDYAVLVSVVHDWDEFLPVQECFYCAFGWVALIGSMVTFKWLIKLLDWVADIIP